MAGWFPCEVTKSMDMMKSSCDGKLLSCWPGIEQHRATGQLLKKSEQHHSGKRRMLVPAGVPELAGCGVRQNMGTYRGTWGDHPGRESSGS